MKKLKKNLINWSCVIALCAGALTLTERFTANGETKRSSAPPQSGLSAGIEQTTKAAPDLRRPTYTVVACNDGDTCRLKATDNTQIKVRLVGIDAPETGKKIKKKQFEGQPGGLEAKEFINQLIVGKIVTLKSYGADPYGRNLAEIMLDNESANLRMVSEGWAEVYRGKAPRDFDIERFKAAQDKAMKDKKGIWALQNYESPKDFRKRTKK